MGKSTMKSATKVFATPSALAAPVKPMRKAEEEIQKVVNSKKQKNDVAVPAEEDSSSSDDEEVSVAKNKVPAAELKEAPVVEEETSNDDDSSSDDDEPPSKAAAQPKKATSDSSEESDSDSDADKGKKAAVVSKKDESTTSDESDEESEEEAPSSDSDERADDESDTDDESDESEDDESDKTDEEEPPKKRIQPITLITPKVQNPGSKTLFIGNLSFSIQESDVVDFFKDAGEVQDVRLVKPEYRHFNRFGHVEFTTAEAAQKALELNGEDLMGCMVRLDYAFERGAYTPRSGRENSFQRPGRSGDGTTIFVRGFDKNEGEDQIRSTLEEHFASCGKIFKTRIPTDPEGYIKGMAYIEFSDGDAVGKALELDGSNAGGYALTVQEARPTS